MQRGFIRDACRGYAWGFHKLRWLILLLTDLSLSHLRSPKNMEERLGLRTSVLSLVSPVGRLCPYRDWSYGFWNQETKYDGSIE